MTEYCSDSLKSIVNSLKVVSDTAERGIALIKKVKRIGHRQAIRHQANKRRGCVL